MCKGRLNIYSSISCSWCKFIHTHAYRFPLWAMRNGFLYALQIWFCHADKCQEDGISLLLGIYFLVKNELYHDQPLTQFPRNWQVAYVNSWSPSVEIFCLEIMRQMAGKPTCLLFCCISAGCSLHELITVNQQILACYYIWRIWRIACFR